jgi:hypothetical protein
MALLLPGCHAPRTTRVRDTRNGSSHKGGLQTSATHAPRSAVGGHTARIQYSAEGKRSAEYGRAISEANIAAEQAADTGLDRSGAREAA